MNKSGGSQLAQISPVKIRSNIQKPLDHRGILRHTTHVKNIFPVIFVRKVNVVQEQRKVHQKTLGKMEMDGGALEEADMEHSLSHAAPVLHIPAVLSVEMRMSLR